MDNPLYNGGGKGSNPRNCHTPKFRKNYEGINWAFDNAKGKQLTLKKLNKFKKEFINKAIDNTIKEMVKVSKKREKK